MSTLSMQSKIAIKPETDVAIVIHTGDTINVLAHEVVSLTGLVEIPAGTRVWLMNDASARHGVPISLFRCDEVYIAT